MQVHPANWDSLLNTRHIVQYQYTINNVEYTGNDVQGVPTIEKPMMLEPVIGRCCTGTLTITIRKKSGVQIPKAAPVTVNCRLVSDDGTITTDWIPQGRFWITKRTGFGDLLALTCRDAMSFSGDTYADKTAITTWPATMASVLTEIATLMGVQIDSRTQINTGSDYVIQKPENDYLISEILSQIAVAHGGNFIITEQGKLRLVPFPATTYPVYNLKQAYSNYTPYSTGENTISRVTVTDDSQKSYTSGDSTGTELNGACLTATQLMVSGLCGTAYRFENGTLYIPAGSLSHGTAIVTDSGLTVNSVAGTIRTAVGGLLGRTFMPYQISGAYLDPCVELGDTFTAIYRGTELNLIANSILVSCTTGYTCQIENGVMQHDEEEIAYVTPQEARSARTSRTTAENKRAIAETKATIAANDVIYERHFTATDKRVTSTMSATGVKVDANGDPVMVLNPETGEYEYEFDTTGSGVTLASRVEATAGQLTAEVTRATGAESTLSGRIQVNSNKVGVVVEEKNGQNVVKTSSIVAGINSQDKTSSSYVDISADYINLTGYVRASTIEAEIGIVDALVSNTGYIGTIRASGIHAGGNIVSDGSVIGAGLYIGTQAPYTSLGNAVYSFGTPTSSGGQISIPWTKVDGTAGTPINFNMTDMAYYQSHIGIASTGSWAWDPDAASGNGAYIRTITPNAGASATIDFPTVTAVSGINYNSTTHTYSASAVAKYDNRDVSSLATATSGTEAYSAGRAAVTLSNTLSWTTTPASGITVNQNAVTVSTSGRTDASGTASELPKTINLYSQGSTNGLTATFYVTHTDSSDANRIIKRQITCSDANLLAGNIKSGVSIFGVTGSYSGGSGAQDVGLQGSTSGNVILEGNSTTMPVVDSSIQKSVGQLKFRFTAILSNGYTVYRDMTMSAPKVTSIVNYGTYARLNYDNVNTGSSYAYLEY